MGTDAVAEATHATPSFGDGLEEMRRHLSVADVANLICSTARWVDPRTFELLPVWFPEYARGKDLHNDRWNKKRKIKKKETGEVLIKKEGNTQANISLCQALGISNGDRPNWTCCHIWGIDDPSFVSSNTVVKDHRFFTCLANMVLLPTPLKAFTDSMPEIKAMLRQCSETLYGWSCDHPDLKPSTGLNFDQDDFPSDWRGLSSFPGIVPINDKIRRAASKRKKSIFFNLDTAGPFFPRDEVLNALDYWSIKAD